MGNKMKGIPHSRLPWWLSDEESSCQCRGPGFNPWVWKYPLEKGMTTHHSILAWRISRTKKPDRLPSMGSQKVGHSLAIEQQFHKAGRPRLSETKSASSKASPVVLLFRWLHHRPLDWDLKTQKTPWGCLLLQHHHFTDGKTEFPKVTQ